MKFLMAFMMFFISTVVSAQNVLVESHYIGGSPEKCAALLNEIDKDFEKVNYCDQDNDCKALELFERYGSWFSCSYPYINKDFNEELILKKIDSYLNLCLSGTIDCATPSKPICVNKKCVGSFK